MAASRKLYVSVAGTLNKAYRAVSENPLDNTDAQAARLDTIVVIAHGLASDFAADNPRFDRQRFMNESLKLI